jgi:hypothetical protein
MEVFVVQQHLGLEDQTVDLVIVLALGLEHVQHDPRDADLVDLLANGQIVVVRVLGGLPRRGFLARLEVPDQFGLQGDGHAHRPRRAGIGHGHAVQVGVRPGRLGLAFDAQGDLQPGLGQPAEQVKLALDQRPRPVLSAAGRGVVVRRRDRGFVAHMEQNMNKNDVVVKGA